MEPSVYEKIVYENAPKCVYNNQYHLHFARTPIFGSLFNSYGRPTCADIATDNRQTKSRLSITVQKQPWTNKTFIATAELQKEKRTFTEKYALLNSSAINLTKISEIP